MHIDHQYKLLISKILQTGHDTHDRTGVGTRAIFGYQMRFNLADGFPVITLRKTAWKSAIAEMIGFMRAYDNAAQFRELGCKFWDANALAYSGGDDLGAIYGCQARGWIRSDGNGVLDQVKEVYDQIRNNPSSRRKLVSHWRPDEFANMALPACHAFYQFHISGDKMSLQVYMRSNDIILGLPANVVEYAWLLEVTAYAFGYKAHELIYDIGDAHIYHNHIDGAKLMMQRNARKLPVFKCSISALDAIYDYKNKEHEVFDYLTPDMFFMDGYKHGQPIKFEMAV